jgi:hypothetical protein
MGAPRSVIIDIENKGLSHTKAHSQLSKTGMFVSPTKQEPQQVIEQTIVEEIVVKEEIVKLVEEIVVENVKEKQEPVIVVPELNVESVSKKNNFLKKKKITTDLT